MKIKNIIIITLMLMTITVFAGDQTRIYMESSPNETWVRSAQNERSMRTPTKLKNNELNLGITPRGNPIRKAYGFRVMEEQVNEIINPTNGLPEVVTNMVPVAWKYCKFDGNNLIPMTTLEREARDVYDVDKKIAKERAQQNAKSAEEIALEVQFKLLVEELGFTVPINKGSLMSMMGILNTQLAQLLADNKMKEAIQIIAKIQSISFLWQKLGDDIYSPYIGE